MEDHRRCALLVEDEFLVALETEELLRDLGCEEIVSAASVEDALAAIREKPPHMAFVDVNLSGEGSWPLLRLLAKEGIPFAVLTGYAISSDVLRAYGDPPLLRKPVNSRMLAAAIAALEEAPSS